MKERSPDGAPSTNLKAAAGVTVDARDLGDNIVKGNYYISQKRFERKGRTHRCTCQTTYMHDLGKDGQKDMKLVSKLN